MPRRFIFNNKVPLVVHRPAGRVGDGVRNPGLLRPPKNSSAPHRHFNLSYAFASYDFAMSCLRCTSRCSHRSLGCCLRPSTKPCHVRQGSRSQAYRNFFFFARRFATNAVSMPMSRTPDMAGMRIAAERLRECVCPWSRPQVAVMRGAMSPRAACAGDTAARRRSLYLAGSCYVVSVLIVKVRTIPSSKL